VKILYLYAEVMGYTMATIKALVELGSDVHVVHWDRDKLTPYQIPDLPHLKKYPRSLYNYDSLRTLADELSPAITVVSGWQDHDYVKVIKYLRNKGGIVVGALDQRWHGTARQHFVAMLGKFRYFNGLFSHAWIPGVYQYEYAKKLGFRNEEIIFDLYCADLTLFHAAYDFYTNKKSFNYPHEFLYVGRLERIKGLSTLLAAWKVLGSRRKDWELHLVGTGSLKDELNATPGIVVRDFMQPDKLVNEIAEAGCFILPSRSEPWGVVVHEFAAAGLPLILSDVVGAATAFLVPGLNGYFFKTNETKALAEAMSRIIGLTDNQLLEMGHSSHQLSKRITPLTSAKNLLSIHVF